MSEGICSLLAAARRDGLAIDNYVIPGLSSFLLQSQPWGIVRAFLMTREQNQDIAPHTHRYDLTSHVVSGHVDNTIWTNDGNGDDFAASELKFSGYPGGYERSFADRVCLSPKTTRHGAGETYYMSHRDIHSIRFSRDALVVVFENPSKTDRSLVFDPVSSDRVCTISGISDWMFLGNSGAHS